MKLKVKRLEDSLLSRTGMSKVVKITFIYPFTLLGSSLILVFIGILGNEYFILEWQFC
jgi:hypothetical protein